jgi:3-hydroxyisobutyrate dehydrogenase-like beta-hydroxyacid dehydrogenase
LAAEGTTWFEDVTPIFRSIAKQWFYMGPAGSGVAMKLVVNTLLGVGMQAIAEAVAFSRGLGIERNPVRCAHQDSRGRRRPCGESSRVQREMITRPQFTVRLMHKGFLLIGAKAAKTRGRDACDT